MHIYDTEAIGFVYVWLHLDSGHYYIGSHRGTPDDGYIGSGKHFKLAVKRYGIEAFHRTIDYVGPDYRKEESDLIRFFDAVNCPLSYNLAHIDANYTAHSAETRAKISAKRALQVMSADSIKRAADKNRGKVISEKQRQQISDAHKGRVHTEQARQNMRDGWARRRAQRIAV